jgi:hypothetical protein
MPEIIRLFLIIATTIIPMVAGSPKTALCGPKPELPASCDPADEKSCVQPLLAGEEAPFEGQLLTFRRAAYLAVEAGGCTERLAIEAERLEGVWSAKLQTAEDLRRHDAETHQLELDLVLKRLEQAEELLTPPWWERPAFVAGVTAVLTVGVVVLSTWVLHAAIPD